MTRRRSGPIMRTGLVATIALGLLSGCATDGRHSVSSPHSHPGRATTTVTVTAPADPVVSAPNEPGAPTAASSSTAAAAPADRPSRWADRAPALVALGDSIASGYNCDCRPYPDLYGDHLAEVAGQSVPVADLGIPGATSASLLDQLTETAVLADLRTATDVTIEIGANDFYEPRGRWEDGTCGTDLTACFGPTAATLSTNLSKAISIVHTSAPTARITVLDYWDVFEDGSAAQADDSGFVSTGLKVTALANATISQVAATEGLPFVSTVAAFRGADGTADPTALLAGDGDHPNAAGHQRIADLLIAAMQADGSAA